MKILKVLMQKSEEEKGHQLLQKYIQKNNLLLSLRQKNLKMKITIIHLKNHQKNRIKIIKINKTPTKKKDNYKVILKMKILKIKIENKLKIKIDLMNKVKKMEIKEEGVHKINIEEIDMYIGKEEADLEVTQMTDTTTEKIIIIQGINSLIIQEIINITDTKEIEVAVQVNHRRKITEIKSNPEIYIIETDDEHINIIFN